MTSKSKILIIDDDGSNRETLTDYFETQGFSIRSCEQQIQALTLAKSFLPNIIILNIAIEDGAGLALFLKLRQISEVPVIFLATETHETDCIISLEIGGDDYITMPCNPRELNARVKAVLRRVDQGPQAVKLSPGDFVNFGGCTYSFATHTLIDQAGRTVKLSRNERKLLGAFLANPNKVLSRESLLNEIKNRPKNIFDRSVDNLISRLRKKMEINPQSPKLIKTYWGGGYSLVVDISAE